MKKCNTCGTIDQEAFSPSQKTKCKSCRKQYQIENADKLKEYRTKNKVNIEEKRKEYTEKNKEKIALKKKNYYSQHEAHLKQKRKEYTEKNKEKIAKTTAQYAIDNKESLDIKRKEYRENNKENIANKKKIYRLNNPELIAAQNEQCKKNKAIKLAEHKIQNGNNGDDWIFYVCEFNSDTDAFFKYGITSKSVNDRYNKSHYRKYNMTIIKEVYGSEEYIKGLERFTLLKTKEDQYTFVSTDKFPGYTECRTKIDWSLF